MHRLELTRIRPVSRAVIAVLTQFAARYIIDKHNKSPDVQQAAIDNAHYFFSLSPQDRRAHSERMATELR